MSDITIGQYVEGRSLIYRLDVRVKLVLMLCGITFVFIAGNYFSMALITAFTIFIMLLTGISLFKYIKSIKAVIMIVLFTAILNLFYGSGEPIFKWGFMEITEAGINNAVFVAARVILIVLMSGVLTFTTSPTDLTDGLERIMKPLKIFHIKVHEIAMMMSIALRFIPTLFDEFNKISNAQKSRGADLESGNFITRIKAFVPILIPLFISSFRRANDLATAMECRCYNSGDGRTRMKVLKIKPRDIIALSVSVLVFVGVILCNIFLPSPVR